MNRIARFAASLGLAALLAGCAGTARYEEDDSEYHFVMETGSAIPKKVKRGQLSDGSQNIEKVQGDAIWQLQRDQVNRRLIGPGG